MSKNESEGKLCKVHGYRTTDGRVFNGGQARVRALSHQEIIDSKEKANQFIEEAEKIFGINNRILTEKEIENLEELIDQLSNQCVFGSDGDGFDDMIHNFITLVSIMPAQCHEMMERLKSYPIVKMGAGIRWDSRKFRLVKENEQ